MEKVLNRTFIVLAAVLITVYFMKDLIAIVNSKTSTTQTYTRKQIEDSMLNAFSERDTMQNPKPIYMGIIPSKVIHTKTKPIPSLGQLLSVGDTEVISHIFPDKPVLLMHVIKRNGNWNPRLTVYDNMRIVAEYDTCGDLHVYDSAATIRVMMKEVANRFNTTH